LASHIQGGAVATRNEKLALNYLGLVKLAFTKLYLGFLTRTAVTGCYQKADYQKELTSHRRCCRDEALISYEAIVSL
jgi:hypothetical protein